MKRRENLEGMSGVEGNTRAERSFIFPLGIDGGSSIRMNTQKRMERRRGKKKETSAVRRRFERSLSRPRIDLETKEESGFCPAAFW